MEAKHTPEAIFLANDVLTAASSGLQHYSLPGTRDKIMAAAQRGIDAGRADLLEALKALRYAYGHTNSHVIQAEADKQARAAIAKATGSEAA